MPKRKYSGGSRSVVKRQKYGALATAGAAASLAVTAARRAYGAYKRGKAIARAVKNAFPKKSAPARKRASMAYKTTGASFAKFRRPRRRPKKDIYRQRGCVKKIENGGTYSGPTQGAIYLGHATAPIAQTLTVACCAIVKRLFQKLGHEVSNFTDVAMTGSDKLQLSITGYLDPMDPSVAQQNYAIQAADTYEGVASQLFLLITTQLGISPNTVWEKVWLNEMTDPAQTVALLMLKNLRLHFSCRSDMSIQNRTLAGTTGAPDPDNTDITNNPIYGRAYWGGGTGFIPKWRKSGDTSYVDFIADRSFGFIKNNSSDTVPEVINKPPYGSFFQGTKKTTTVRIMPGQIKKDVVSGAFTVHFNSFSSECGKFYYEFAASTVEIKTKYGSVMMYGLDKVLDSRASENVISVGFEITQTIKCYASEVRKTETDPLVFVGTANIGT